MYILNDKIVDKILKRKFMCLVGSLCERIENFEITKSDKSDLVKAIKFELKKTSYDTMREIKEQMSSFSEGTTVSVDFDKPTQ